MRRLNQMSRQCRPKVKLIQLGSAHQKHGVWARPKICVLCYKFWTSCCEMGTCMYDRNCSSPHFSAKGYWCICIVVQRDSADVNDREGNLTGRRMPSFSCANIAPHPCLLVFINFSHIKISSVQAVSPNLRCRQSLAGTRIISKRKGNLHIMSFWERKLELTLWLCGRRPQSTSLITN